MPQSSVQNPLKVYVDVYARFRRDGMLLPVAITWEDGREYTVDKVTRIERCASLRAGGIGLRYTCIISGAESHLFYEVDKWFVERR